MTKSDRADIRGLLTFWHVDAHTGAWFPRTGRLNTLLFGWRMPQ